MSLCNGFLKITYEIINLEYLLNKKTNKKIDLEDEIVVKWRIH